MGAPLNPFARAWVPGVGLRPSSSYPPPAEQPERPPLPSMDGERDPAGGGAEPGQALVDLPEQVLAAVVTHLTTPVDVVNCALACKGLLAPVAASPLYLDLHRPTSSAQEPSAARDARMVQSLVRYTPGAMGLDLSGCLVEDRDVLQLLAALPHLRHLHLNGCRKLTPALAATLRQRGGSAESRNGPHTRAGAGDASGLQLQTLDLQRCFQLSGSALGSLLHAAAAPDGALRSLTALAMSHLELGSSVAWLPAELPPPFTTNLRVLGLSSCSGLGLPELAALAGLCPCLEFLLLGGASLATSARVALLRNAASPVTSHPLEVLGLSEAVTRDALALRPRLVDVDLGRGDRAGGRELRGRFVEWPDRPWTVDAAAALAAILFTLPRLRAVDLTFLPAPLLARVAAALASRGDTAACVWDMTLAECVQRALRLLPCAATGDRAGGGGMQHAGDIAADSRGSTDDAAMRLALRCAAACSNAVRLTPLHVAAERGCGTGLRGLLRLGARLDAKDRGGAVPLFLAAEAGHAECVKALLDAGADPQVANAAGERPLYIAALRGHTQVVHVLLSACRERGIAWHEPNLYGDRWTPLMAAAVADRVDVARALMAAAGSSGGALISAVNRYGQGVLHIAARKASPPLLHLLLSAAAGDSCVARDDAGDTPLDVARREHNVFALEQLTAHQMRHHSFHRQLPHVRVQG